MQRKLCAQCSKLTTPTKVKTQNPIDSRLNSFGLRRRSTPTDGNCLFHAVSSLLSQQNIAVLTAAQLRETVCNFIDENLDLFRVDIEREYGSASKFLNIMRKQGTYGCCIVLNAISILFDVNFHIHFLTSVFETNPGSNRRNLHIVFLRDLRSLNGHWEATEKISL